eukprot:TRINITY_DN1582_c0_g2_i11.p1 TRINITY_DN1582_c0_g2~~TRINITY_DN1582_c0_g2_i11.p1  ORF type:complete len:208 (-),score=-6.05 TRINITY_DN1582_c0_g2_i11:153-776(-)
MQNAGFGSNLFLSFSSLKKYKLNITFSNRTLQYPASSDQFAQGLYNNNFYIVSTQTYLYYRKFAVQFLSLDCNNVIKYLLARSQDYKNQFGISQLSKNEIILRNSSLMKQQQVFLYFYDFQGNPMCALVQQVCYNTDKSRSEINKSVTIIFYYLIQYFFCSITHVLIYQIPGAKYFIVVFGTFKDILSAFFIFIFEEFLCNFLGSDT